MTAAIQARLSHADQIVDEAIERSLFGTDPISIVKSPPGAGKTFLVECAAAVAVGQPAMRVVIVTPGVSQLYDIAKRLLEYRLPRLELAHAKHRVLPPNLVGRIAASSGWRASLNSGPGVVVTNVHLLASYLDQLGPGSFDLMIVDEAYQLAAADFPPRIAPGDPHPNGRGPRPARSGELGRHHQLRGRKAQDPLVGPWLCHRSFSGHARLPPTGYPPPAARYL